MCLLIRPISVIPPWLDRCMFDVLVDEFRTHSTEWLRREREALVSQQRNLRTRELAVLRVLDERGQVDCSMGSQGESARTVRDKVETARALESLPAIASVAFDGGFSMSSCRRWCRSPTRSRIGSGPGGHRMWIRWSCRGWRGGCRSRRRRIRGRGSRRVSFGCGGRGARRCCSTGVSCPTTWACAFEAEINRRAELMKPKKGQPWAPFEQRAADALMSLCDPIVADDDRPSLAPLAGIQAAVPLHGPAEIAGIPIADSLLEQLRANASITPVLVDDDGAVMAIGRAAPAISEKLRRAVLLRDARCRVPGCARRRGLQVHHLLPRSWDGTDEISNLACVCPAHHRLLIPHGLLALVGNPNLPDGLRLVTASRGPPRVPV